MAPVVWLLGSTGEVGFPGPGGIVKLRMVGTSCATVLHGVPHSPLIAGRFFVLTGDSKSTYDSADSADVGRWQWWVQGRHVQADSAPEDEILRGRSVDAGGWCRCSSGCIGVRMGGVT